MTENSQQAAPPPRTGRAGPRPLPLHLTAALSSLTSSLAALPSARLGLFPWHPSLAARAASLTPELAAANPAALLAAVGQEIDGQLRRMLAGIDAYRAHDYHRDVDDPPAIWSRGTTRLLDYGGAASAPVVVFVPSLVNRAYVLDLSQRRSLMRFLAENGLRPLLVDWQAPGEVEKDYDLTDYVAGRLDAIIETAAGLAGGPIGLVGYCMGGNLTVAAALRQQNRVAALALLATPWDFHADLPEHAKLFWTAEAGVDALIDAFGELPVDILQSFFLSLDPDLTLRKFSGFSRLDQGGQGAADFVAIEDWLNDGVPLAGPAARECLVGWYGNNSPKAGDWRVADQAVDPAGLRLPTLAAIPASDRIVPPDSANALADAIPGATRMTPPSGHIGMVVGGRAPDGLWRPLRDWLLSVTKK